MKFTDLFVKRPVLAVVVNLVILIAGLQSIRALSVRQFPRSDIAIVRVSTVYVGASADLVDVREAVLTLRRNKGMLLDPIDHDTWSVGSFFVNPFVDEVPAAAQDCPQWTTDGRIKLSAAWLIEAAGFHRGYGRGRVSVSTKHSLALTNRGGATTAELLSLAAEIRGGVEDKFGIRLRPEAHLAGVAF